MRRDDLRFLSLRGVFQLFNVPNHEIAIRPDEYGLVSEHRIRKKRWTETYRGTDPSIVPYIPHGFAEVVFLASRLDWGKMDPQIFPVLPINVSREFGADRFYFVFKVLENTFPRGKVYLVCVYRSPFGVTRGSPNAVLTIDRSAWVPVRVGEDPKLVESGMLSFPRRWDLRLPRFRPKDRTFVLKPVISVQKPIELSLWTTETKKSKRNLVLLFDLVRVVDQHVFGTHLDRNFVRGRFEDCGFGVLEFRELLGYCPIFGTEKTTGDFDSIRKSVLALWRKLPKARRSSIVLLCLEENCFLAPRILADQPDRPFLVLINPFWTTLANWARNFESDQRVRNELKLEDPEETLPVLLRQYARPVLAIGRNSPTTIPVNVTFRKSGFRGRFLNHIGIPTRHGQPGFEYMAEPWAERPMREVIQWLENQFDLSGSK